MIATIAGLRENLTAELIESWSQHNFPMQEQLAQMTNLAEALQRERDEALAALSEREADAEKLARYIVQHLCHLVAPDYACKQCAPNAEYLIEGFVCGYHRAVAIDAAIKESK